MPETVDCDSSLYSELGQELERLNQELSEMKEVISDTCVRAYMTEMELAMLFNPELLSTVKTTERECGACIQVLDQQKGMSQNQTSIETNTEK